MQNIESNKLLFSGPLEFKLWVVKYSDQKWKRIDEWSAKSPKTPFLPKTDGYFKGFVVSD